MGANDLVYYHGVGSPASADICEAVERTYYNDYEAPYVTDMDPDEGEIDVNLNTDIEGSIVDDGYGVDESSVTVDVATAARGEIAGQLTLGGDMLEIEYEFEPDAPLPHFTEILVTVDAADLYNPPNEMGEYTYTFWTRSFHLEAPDDGDVIDVFDGRGEASALATGIIKTASRTDAPGDVDVTFQWEEVVRANSYELFVDDNDDFSSPEVHATDITGTEYTHSFTVTEDTTYYWYVICNAPDGDFDSADVYSFEFDYNNANVAPASLGHIKAGFAE